MGLPANIRVNVGAPFPATVKGTAGIAIGRNNGVWTVGLAYTQFGVQNPPPAANYATDYMLIYDSIAQTYFQVPLTGFGADNAQRAVTSGPVVIAPTDQILHLNLSAPGTISLPPYGTRNGVALIFKDVGRQATANPQTITAATGEFIDGTLASVPFAVNGMSLRLVPAHDGVNTGWFLE
jgi:hypothetical protein